MDASIIICTRNRAESLQATLPSIGVAAIPKGLEVELLVIDNGSTDGTENIVRKAHLPNVTIRYLRESTVGLSNARNTGLNSALGEIIVFTDDDVRVPLNWIEGMTLPILANKADAVAGGVIFPAEIAAALSRAPFSTRREWYASTEKLHPSFPHRMVGANMAFHCRVLKKVPTFDIELGPGALGFADETLFSAQLIAAGFRLVGAFDVAVEHHFDAERLNAPGILDMARRMGRSNAYMFHHWKHQKLEMPIPRLFIRRLRRFLLKHSLLPKHRVRTNLFEESIQSEMELAFCREYIVQRRFSPKYRFSPSSDS